MTAVCRVGFLKFKFSSGSGVQSRPVRHAAKYRRGSLNRCGKVVVFRPKRSATYVDAAYCYRPSSVVCRPVGLYVCLSVTLVSPSKTDALIEAPFGLRTRVGLGNHVLDRRPDPEMGRAILKRGGASHGKV